MSYRGRQPSSHHPNRLVFLILILMFIEEARSYRTQLRNHNGAGRKQLCSLATLSTHLQNALAATPARSLSTSLVASCHRIRSTVPASIRIRTPFRARVISVTRSPQSFRRPFSNLLRIPPTAPAIGPSCFRLIRRPASRPSFLFRRERSVLRASAFDRGR